MTDREDPGSAVLCAMILLIALLLAVLAATAYFTPPDPETARRASEAGAQLGGL